MQKENYTSFNTRGVMLLVAEVFLFFECVLSEAVCHCSREIFPYLVVVIGLENVLVLTKSVVSTPVDLEVKLRIAQGEITRYKNDHEFTG